MAANNDVKENEITQASAQATLANLKEIRVVTTDGSSKSYGKQDFMSVIAAGIKAYFSSIAAGNISGILTSDAGKAGISALADVASVLGAANTSSATALSDCDTPEKRAHYISSTTAHAPIAANGYMITDFPYYQVDTPYRYGRQTAYYYGGQNVNKVYVRSHNGTSWNAWLRVYDESILTDSTILSPLASALKPYLDAL